MKIRHAYAKLSELLDVDLWCWRSKISAAPSWHVVSAGSGDRVPGGGRRDSSDAVGATPRIKKGRRGQHQKKNTRRSGRRGRKSTGALKRARLDFRLAARTAEAARSARSRQAGPSAPRAYRGKRVLKVVSQDVTTPVQKTAEPDGGTSEVNPFTLLARRFPKGDTDTKEIARAIYDATLTEGLTLAHCSHRTCRLWHRTAGLEDLCAFCRERRLKGLSCGHA
jgi:hypothetical protein